MTVKATLLSLLLISTFSSPLFAANLAQRYTSYNALHTQTDYGSLFLNEGHFRINDSRRNKDFIEIEGNGDVALPKQRGYCFAFNHYGSPYGDNVAHRYTVKISKQLADGSWSEEEFTRSYRTTAKSWSGDLPDLCISGLAQVSAMKLSLSSTDGTYFNRQLTIALR